MYLHQSQSLTNELPSTGPRLQLYWCGFESRLRHKVEGKLILALPSLTLTDGIKSQIGNVTKGSSTLQNFCVAEKTVNFFVSMNFRKNLISSRERGNEIRCQKISEKTENWAKPVSILDKKSRRSKKVCFVRLPQTRNDLTYSWLLRPLNRHLFAGTCFKKVFYNFTNFFSAEEKSFSPSRDETGSFWKNVWFNP